MSRFSNKALRIAAVAVGALALPASVSVSQEIQLPEQVQTASTSFADGAVAFAGAAFAYLPDGTKVMLKHCRNTGTP